MRFEGKTAVVTGAGGGMGWQIAVDLLKEGANVLLLDIKPRPAALDEMKGNFRYEQVDLTDEAAVRRVIDTMSEEFGALHYLVNCAAVLWFDRDKSVLDIDLDVWDRVMAINLNSVVYTVRHAAPHMIESGGGAMVHFSTPQCVRGDASPQDAYSTSKAGVLTLSRSLAIQLAEHDIRSNCILPGATLTPMQDRWQDNEGVIEAISQQIPLKRLGLPRDMANACLFLLSEDAGYITGTSLFVDGGFMAKL